MALNCVSETLASGAVALDPYILWQKQHNLPLLARAEHGGDAIGTF